MLTVKCVEEWDKDFPEGIRVNVQDDEKYFIMQIPYESLNKSVKACEEEMLRQMDMMFSGEYIFDGTGIYKKTYPERKVWQFIDKEKRTEDEQKEIEKIYMDLRTMMAWIGKGYMQMLYDATSKYPNEVMKILKRGLD